MARLPDRGALLGPGKLQDLLCAIPEPAQLAEDRAFPPLGYMDEYEKLGYPVTVQRVPGTTRGIEQSY